MATLVDHGNTSHLVRSCGPSPGDWIRVAPSRPGFERIEASFQGHAFDPHRHDTYAIGITTRGVQTFGYRGIDRHSLPGCVITLHPDETHDGRAGSDAGFCYRMLYIEPGFIQDALGDGHKPLPFVTNVVSTDGNLLAALRPVLEDLETPVEDLAFDRFVTALADALSAATGSSSKQPLSAVHLRAVREARAFIDANVEAGVSSHALETITGLDRYALARHFRVCLGTSPYRYLVMRRLDRARGLIQVGHSLCDAALASGFADQSHMTRHFKKAFGMAPGRWAAFSRAQRAMPERPDPVI